MTRFVLIVAMTLPFALIACDPAAPVVGELSVCDADDVGVNVLNADIRGDILTADVGYSGCDTVPLSVCWHDGAFIESNPVQAALAILAPTAGMCAAAFEDTVEIDLSALREAYEDNDDGSPGTVLIALNGTSVEYPL